MEKLKLISEICFWWAKINNFKVGPNNPYSMNIVNDFLLTIITNCHTLVNQHMPFYTFTKTYLTGLENIQINHNSTIKSNNYMILNLFNKRTTLKLNKNFQYPLKWGLNLIHGKFMMNWEMQVAVHKTYHGQLRSKNELCTRVACVIQVKKIE